MARTYESAWSVVKWTLSSSVVFNARISLAIACAWLLFLPLRGWAQGLPQFGPLNPVASSRSGLYFEPYREPAPGHWIGSFALDYGSIIEYNQLTRADYVLDSELLRLSLSLSRDLGSRTFVTLNTGLGGAYAGFMDGFLDWYHRTLGITVSERDRRPRDRFLYTITLPDGSSVNRSRPDLYLEDLRVGFGLRATPQLQSVFSLTLPTSTAPEGYRRGVPSAGVLNTLRMPLQPGLVYEGSLDLGFTPDHGRLPAEERNWFVAATSGFRLRVWGHQSVYANVFYHSPYYQATTLPALDRRELSLDFGWILAKRMGGEWRLGMTEDLEPGGPGVDLIVRLGRSF
jgi:Protein of unknown function (DUF3187)